VCFCANFVCQVIRIEEMQFRLLCARTQKEYNYSKGRGQREELEKIKKSQNSRGSIFTKLSVMLFAIVFPKCSPA